MDFNCILTLAATAIVLLLCRLLTAAAARCASRRKIIKDPSDVAFKMQIASAAAGGRTDWKATFI